VVVLGRDEHEPVEGGDLLSPLFGVVVGVLAERRSVRLVEVRQRVVAQVDELELRVSSRFGGIEDPPRDLLPVAIGAGASENDSDPTHCMLSFESSRSRNDFAARHR
jgi:hypothetical protein